MFWNNWFKEQPKTQAPLTKELAWSESAFLSSVGGLESYNPDMLVQKKGADIYRKMLTDEQVSAVYNLIVNIIISREWVFEKRNDDQVQDDIVKFFEYQIKNALHGTWIKALKTVMLGKAQGFSVSEKVWGNAEFEGRQYWVVKNLKTKPYDTFEFIIDDYDNRKSIVQDQNGASKRLDPSKFIIYVNNPDIDPIWGSSDLRQAYKSYWLKDTVTKFEAIWLERIAGGFIVASQRDGAPTLSATERSKFQTVLQRIQKATSMMVPQGVDVEVINATDTESFDRAIKRYDRGIAKALLVPNLLGLSEEGSFGSRSLGETQFKMFQSIIKEQGDYLADTMNEQFFSQLAWYNFGVQDPPLYKFQDFTIEDRRKIAEAWTAAVKDGAVVNTFDDEQKTRELLTYNDRDEDAEPVNKPIDQVVDDQEKKEELSEKHFTEEQTFIDRVDFKEIGKTFDDNQEKFVREMSGPVDRIFAEIEVVIQKIIGDLPSDKDKIKYDKISETIQQSISAKSKIELRNSVGKNFNTNYEYGRKEAQKTVKEVVKNQPSAIRNRLNLSCAIAPAVACKDDVWSVKHFIDGISLQAIANWIKSKSFKITGDVTEDMISKAEQVLIDGITEEKSYREITNDLRDVLGEYIGTTNTQGEITSKANRARLETIARTNITNIFNQAQLAVYASPELGDFVEGLEYSAILDSRTTNFCKSYNERKFKRNDPIWGTITPPNHFNCRSVMIPLTIFDEWKPSRSLTTQPSEGFR